MRPGFRLLSDLTGLESMDPTGTSYIAAMMDLFAAKQVGLVVRVIPDPHKDIGLNILSYFHYGSQVQVVTYQNLSDALQSPLRVKLQRRRVKMAVANSEFGREDSSGTPEGSGMKAGTSSLSG
jgi:hypothetical protein